MPRAGGESDKLGNRYEGVWTVDALLDVLNGEAMSVTVEPFPKSEALGIEFIKELPDGTREFHSAKRQKPGNVWSLADLTSSNGEARSIIGTCYDFSTIRTKTFVPQRLTVSETFLPTDCMTSNR